MISDRAHLFSEKRRSSRTAAVCVGVAVLFFVLGAWVRTSFAAWEDPTDLTPPNGGTAPINVGSTTQSKTGGLNVATTSGVLGVGTSNPSSSVKLDVVASGLTGGIKVTGATQIGIETNGSNTGGNFQGSVQGVVASTTGSLASGDQHMAVYGDAQDSNVSGAQSLGVYGIAGDATVAGATSVGVYGVGGTEKVSAASSFAGFFQGFTRVDPDKDGGTTENAFDVYGKVGGARTGSAVYIEQNAGHNYGLWVSGNGGNAAGRFNGKLEAVTAGPTETPAILGDASAGGTDPNFSRYGVQGLGSVVDSGGEISAGVSGEAGASNSGGSRSFGVYGISGDASNGGVSSGVAATSNYISSPALYAEHADRGLAGYFDGPVDIKDGSLSVEQELFVVENTLLALSPSSKVKIGDISSENYKLGVEGGGKFSDFVESNYLRIKDNEGADFYKTFLRFENTTPQWCVELDSGGQCTTRTQSCPASLETSQFVGKNLEDGDDLCVNKCSGYQSPQCFYACDGRNACGGTKISGSVACDNGITESVYNGDTGFCTCSFFGNGPQYEVGTRTSPDWRCVNLDIQQRQP